MSVILFILIGAVAGWLSGKIMKGRGFGALGNIAVGIAGAIIGGFLFGILGLTATSLIGKLVMATVRAVALLALVGALKKA